MPEAEVTTKGWTVSLSVPALLFAYSHMQPIETGLAQKAQRPSHTIKPPRRSELADVLGILDKLELHIIKLGDDVKKTLKELGELPHMTLSFTESEHLRIKAFYADENRVWDGDHVTLRIIQELMKVF